MIGDALKHHEVVVMEVADDGGARHHLHVGHGFQACRYGRGVICGADTVNAARRQIRNAAEPWVFIGEQDAGTCVGCGFCC